MGPSLGWMGRLSGAVDLSQEPYPVGSVGHVFWLKWLSPGTCISIVGVKAHLNYNIASGVWVQNSFQASEAKLTDPRVR